MGGYGGYWGKKKRSAEAEPEANAEANADSMVLCLVGMVLDTTDMEDMVLDIPAYRPYVWSDTYGRIVGRIPGVKKKSISLKLNQRPMLRGQMLYPVFLWLWSRPWIWI
eukprot:TRINITY_DN4528_c0_g1_i1.p1 TRINITY_DN4528_c0_g1~~TRINITY_DN4528_c0_g1_i1.p1  ORF type:complete len:109 (-),score=4.28 TRINITY_DN4528_c0_g1_i1:75-401(-)